MTANQGHPCLKAIYEGSLDAVCDDATKVISIKRGLDDG